MTEPEEQTDEEREAAEREAERIRDDADTDRLADQIAGGHHARRREQTDRTQRDSAAANITDPDDLTADQIIDRITNP